MRCLYCGKELALLKRLTGGGEFCSEAHKQSYQDEYNRLGLSRLLQARTSAAESKAAQKAPPAPVDPVAVAEPAVQEIAVVKVAPPPQPAPPRVIGAPPEPPPPAFAGFVMEKPRLSVSAEAVYDLEPWRFDDAPSAAPPPSLPVWHREVPSGQDPFFTLPSAGLLALDLHPGVCQGSVSAMDTNVAPHEVGHPRVNLSMPLKVASSHEFQPGGSVAIEIAPRPSESSCYASLNGALDFSYSVGVQVFDLVELPTAGIAYPGEDCDVTVAESWTNGLVVDGPVDIIIPAIPLEPSSPEFPAEPETVPTPPATPRAALEALSKLHQDMRDREEAAPPSPPAAPAVETPLDVKENATEETAKPEENMTEAAPREAGEMVAISIKSFAPPKAVPVVDAKALLTNGHPLLPRLKALPLRPKVAPAPRGFSPQAKAPADQPTPTAPKAKPAPSSAFTPAEAPPKPSATEKPVQPVQTPKAMPAAEKPKPPQPPPAKKTASSVEAAKAPQPAKQPGPASQHPAPRATPSVSSPAQPKQEPPVKEHPVKPVAVMSAPPAPSKAQPAPPQKAEPATATTASSPAKNEPALKAPAAKKEIPAAAAPTDHTVPNFGVAVNTSMFGSLKVKLGLAALIAVVSVGAYFVASKPKTAYPVKASDAAGPSIMVGEGGWVEGWAGDPIGLHNSRQITIYRPSLKLSDYRFEFQGQIENQSIGWILRAADPDNYYAMKLQLVSPELPLKLALHKYLVLKGRQVQVGRVPIDVPVKSDTVFSIRVDVRGPKFNTYVQGQPVDVWTDDQLRSGGVGFLNERSERGKIKSVSLSYLSEGTK